MGEIAFITDYPLRARVSKRVCPIRALL